MLSTGPKFDMSKCRHNGIQESRFRHRFDRTFPLHQAPHVVNKSLLMYDPVVVDFEPGQSQLVKVDLGWQEVGLVDTSRKGSGIQSTRHAVSKASTYQVCHAIVVDKPCNTFRKSLKPL